MFAEGAGIVVAVSYTHLVYTKNEQGDKYGMREASALHKEWYEHAEGYCSTLKGKTMAEIAAQPTDCLLYTSCETKMVVTMNARSLQNFFHLRCCSRAQWEIRQLAEEMRCV